MKPYTVLCEPLTLEEEVVFLVDMNNAVEDGELSDEEAAALIDRQYALQSAMEQ